MLYGSLSRYTSRWGGRGLPSLAAGLHLVGERYVIRPDVKLPLAQAQNPAVNTPAVDAHPHVYINTCHLSHQPKHTQSRNEGHLQDLTITATLLDCLSVCVCLTHEMASIMSTPISTQQWAWSARGSGRPDTQ